jgi:mannitol/fructose-specific phosphotransferase system IIA component (Ntr-type)
LSLLFTFAGVILYFIRRDKDSENASAIIHLVQRITNKGLAGDELADELRKIVKHRDEIVHDDFDEAIENSCFVELNGQVDLQNVWRDIAQKMRCEFADYIDLDKFIRLLEERESESSTAINSFVAVPHIIVDSQNVFKIILVRAREGIRFSEDHPEVKCCFILAGSKDRRNLHLRALAAIAKIVQEPEFEDEWLGAESHQHLKDLFLLAQRSR